MDTEETESTPPTEEATLRQRIGASEEQQNLESDETIVTDVLLEASIERTNK